MLAFGADLLIHDCQYTVPEYEERIGFGHSSTDHAAAFAATSKVDRLVLFHHDPMHTDEQLEQMRARVLERWDVEPERCLLAADGMTLEV
jgi:ribonuclease BN (tRNA processing enzyme)